MTGAEGGTGFQGTQGTQGAYPTERELCPDCRRGQTWSCYDWEESSRALCGQWLRSSEATLQCAERTIERLREALADWDLIKDEPVVRGRLLVIKAARRHNQALAERLAELRIEEQALTKDSRNWRGTEHIREERLRLLGRIP